MPASCGKTTPACHFEIKQLGRHESETTVSRVAKPFIDVAEFSSERISTRS